MTGVNGGIFSPIRVFAFCSVCGRHRKRFKVVTASYGRPGTSNPLPGVAGSPGDAVEEAVFKKSEGFAYSKENFRD